jgi:hypothetical protein
MVQGKIVFEQASCVYKKRTSVLSTIHRSAPSIHVDFWY